MEFFNVNVEIINPKTFDSHNETIRFKSKWAARYMAREYANCADVISVDVVDAITGEVILSFNHDGNVIHDVEG